MALLMEKGLAPWGDYAFMEAKLKALYTPSEEARFLAQGTARVGEALGLRRVPVIKRQAISAYDPRVVEATGITMMVTAQGRTTRRGTPPFGDPGHEGGGDPGGELHRPGERRRQRQPGALRLRGSVTNKEVAFVVESVNAALGTDFSPELWRKLGEGVLRLEHRFNHLAGFTHEDDRLPAFFYEEPVPPRATPPASIPRT